MPVTTWWEAKPMLWNCSPAITTESHNQDTMDWFGRSGCGILLLSPRVWRLGYHWGDTSNWKRMHIHTVASPCNPFLITHTGTSPWNPFLILGAQKPRHWLLQNLCDADTVITSHLACLCPTWEGVWDWYLEYAPIARLLHHSFLNIATER